jgi:hypothetical protein
LGNECPSCNNNVSQVNENQTAANIRRVKLYEVATPPISSPVEEWFSTCMVTDIAYDVFSLESCDEMDEPNMDWLKDPQLIVFGSGADISLLPRAMCEKGVGKKLGRTVLQDAQGARLETYERRSAQLECEGDGADLVIIEDDFVVASV